MSTSKNYGLVTDPEEFRDFVRRMIKEGQPFGFDIETGYDGPNYADAAKLAYLPAFKVVGFSFTNADTWARYVPIAHDNGPNMDVVPAARLLWTLLQTGLGVAHNAPFELQGLARLFREVLWDDPYLGAQVQLSNGFFPIFSDSMMEAFMLQEFEPRFVGIGLKGLTFHVFGHKMIEFMDLFPEEDSELGPGTKKAHRRYVRFNSRNLVPKVVEYACEDALWCLSLHKKHYDRVKDMLMFKTEILLMQVIAKMEFEGIALDWTAFEKAQVEVAEFKEKMNEQIQNELGSRLNEVVNINLGSPKQVADMLYERLQLPCKEYTDKGAPSTGESALRALAKEDPVIKQILQFREVNKLLSSYITKYLKELRYAEDGRAHPNHKQHGAATGRMSVDHVSYQQWPKPYKYELDDGTTLKLNYRDFLIAPEGFRIVGFDFSQVELRVLAGMAEEDSLLQAFADGTDIHVATAALMMGIPVDEVTKKQRAVGKTLNFAIVYGSGAENIGELLGITKEEAQEYLDKYFEAFPKLKGWMDARVEEGRDTLYVSTKFGRRYRVWEYDESAKWIRAKGDRMCVNAPVQGGAADYLKLGMVRVDKAITKAGLQDKIRLVMTVHDALEFYVHESVDTQTVIDLINPAVSFPVPGLPEIKADWHEGRRWGSVVEIDLDAQKKICGYGYEDEEGNKHHFDTLQEAYAHMDAAGAPPVQGVPEPELAENIKGSFYEEKELPEEPKWAAKEHQVILTFRNMPLPNPWKTFKLFMAEHPGSDTVILKTPEGEVAYPTKHTLTPQDVDYLSHLMNGVTMTREEI